MEECLDPNIPTVDEESLECGELVSTNCIIAAEADLYLQYGKGSTFTTILNKIKAKLQKYLPKYQLYVVALSQSGTDAPVATVLDNSASISPSFSRNSAGDFTITATGAFPSGKVVIREPNDRPVFDGGGLQTERDIFNAERVDDDTISLKTAKDSAGSINLTDGLLDGANTILEIRIYK